MNASVASENKKRIPIRRRVLSAILVLTSVLLVATVITSLAFMHRMRRGGEEMLAAELRRAHENRWEQVRVAVGIAVFDPAQDITPLDTARRADRLMYADKAPGRSAAVE